MIEESAVILLAAGSSTRFGGEKLLAPVEGKAMARHVLDLIGAFGFARKIAVVRPDLPELTRWCSESGVEAVFNDSPQAGLSHSLKMGVASISDMRAALVLLADMPFVSPAHIEALGKSVTAHLDTLDWAPDTILASYHGLPESYVAAGDPYPRQVEAGAAAIKAAAGAEGVASVVTYQSRVGPLKWIGPDTDAEILATAKAGQVPVVVPLAFVSEHSETLYELDQVYRKAALEAGAPAYLRVPAVGTHPAFIGGLAALVRQTLGRDGIAPDPAWPGCGAAAGCPCRERRAA